jgi:hypothetical protein
MTGNSSSVAQAINPVVNLRAIDPRLMPTRAAEV